MKFLRMKKFTEICCAIFYLAQIGVIQMSASALRCYSCSITSGSSDSRCMNDPMNLEGQSVINCNKKYCTILRQELKDPPGKINTFMRGCEEKPTMLDGVINDPTFKTIYRSCSSDLCNDGDGIKSTNQHNFSPDGYKGENLLVPGLQINAATILGSNVIIIIMSSSLVLSQ